MTALLTAIGLDHRIVRPRYPMLVVLLAIGVTVGSLSGSALTAIGLVTLLTAPIGGSYFAVFEASRLDQLYGTLPLTRAAAEAGIYAHTALIVAVNGLLAALAAGSIAAADHRGVAPASLAVAFALSFLGACVYIGLLYPVYLAVPFSKVNILTNVPFYAVALVIIFVAKRTDWFTHLASVAAFYHRHPAPASTLTLGAGVALLVVSCSVSHATAGASRRR